jgi:hypothetical protein
VIAYASGALPEIIEHGVTGFVVADVEDMGRAITRCECLDVQTCRQTARRRFPLQRMCDAYLDLYPRLAAQAPRRERAKDVRPEPHPRPPGAVHQPSSSHRDEGWGEGTRDDFVPGT